MPITYEHEMNPIVAGLSGWVAGFGQGRAKMGDAALQRGMQLQGQAGAIQQQSFANVNRLFAQQLNHAQRVDLQNRAHQNALGLIGAREKTAFATGFARETGVSYAQAQKQYQQMVQQEMQAAGILTPAGPTVQSAEALSGFQPSMSFEEYADQLRTQRATQLKGQSLASQGLVEEIPESRRKEIESLDNQILQVSMDDTLDPFEREFAVNELQQRKARLESLPKVLRQKPPTSYTFDEDVQAGRIKQVGGSFLGRNRYGEWDEIAKADMPQPETPLVQALKAGSPFVPIGGQNVPVKEYARSLGLKQIKVGDATFTFDDDAAGSGGGKVTYEQYSQAMDQAAKQALQIGQTPPAKLSAYEFHKQQGNLFETPDGKLFTVDDKGNLDLAWEPKGDTDNAELFKTAYARVEARKKAAASATASEPQPVSAEEVVAEMRIQQQAIEQFKGEQGQEAAGGEEGGRWMGPPPPPLPADRSAWVEGQMYMVRKRDGQTVRAFYKGDGEFRTME